MGSLPKLPVIELSEVELKPGTGSWKTAAEEVREALEEYGCFIAAFDRIPFALHNAMLESVKELFDLPQETKSQKIPTDQAVCYYTPKPSLPFFEAFSFENAATVEGTEGFTRLMWPHGNHHFCETTLNFSKLLRELAEMVVRMVFEGYGLEKYCESQLASTVHLTVLAKLEPPQTDEIKGGGQSHTDTSLLTIVDQNHVPGLEIQTKEGHWIPFEPAPSHVMVMAGDAFATWSNGRIHAPSHIHGVTKHGKEANYAASLISSGRNIVQIPR